MGYDGRVAMVCAHAHLSQYDWREVRNDPEFAGRCEEELPDGKECNQSFMFTLDLDDTNNDAGDPPGYYDNLGRFVPVNDEQRYLQWSSWHHV